MLVLALVVDMFADNLYIATVILPVATARYIGDFAVKCKPFVKLAYKFPFSPFGNARTSEKSAIAATRRFYSLCGCKVEKIIEIEKTEV